MRVIKKFLVLFMCVMLTGCGFNNDGKTTINFMTWGSASEMEVLVPIIADYERITPNVKIHIMHIPQDYFKKLHLLFASNLAPDVMLINNFNVPVYAEYLEDVSSSINSAEYFPKSLETLSVDGTLYAVPRDISVLVIYYNKSLFDKYGVGYPTANWTLNEMFDKSKMLTRDGKFGISYEPDVYYALPYIHYFGTTLVDSAGNDISFKASAGINFYQNLVKKYHVAPSDAQRGSKTVAQMFLEQQIAMHLSGRWLVPKYRESAKFGWDVAQFPQYEASIDATGWAVYKKSSKKSEALKFVKYLSSKTSIEKMTKSGLIVPARMDVAESPVFKNGLPEHSSIFLDAARSSNVTKVSKEYIRIVERLQQKAFMD